ncbi:MAG: hypothetical protein IPO38_08605 [Rhodocyclaceae bacterium]|nr:hypothetical protein [Rhodocyclaceae bacterium]
MTTLANSDGAALENFTVTPDTAGSMTNVATLGDATATGYIVDPIAVESPTFVVSNPSMAEATNAVFEISLSKASDAAVTLDLALVSGTAISGSDFAAGLEVSTAGLGGPWTSATAVTIAAGSTTAWVRTTTTADGLSENNESFQPTATRTAGTTNNTSASGTATIVGDIAGLVPPVVSVADLFVDESGRHRDRHDQPVASRQPEHHRGLGDRRRHRDANLRLPGEFGQRCLRAWRNQQDTHHQPRR